MKRFFVTGTDTGIGKTWISTILIELFQRAGYQTGAYKPVCSGAEFPEAGKPRWADADLLQAAANKSLNLDGESLSELTCPQRFIAPLAPPEAARLEGKSVNRGLLRSGLHAWLGQAQIVVVEGAGGFLSPLSDQDTLADLASEFQAPVIVVAGNRLGVINHTLLTVEAIRQRGLKIAAIVLNDITPVDEASELLEPIDLSVKSNLQMLQHWLPETPLFQCRWRSRQLEATTHNAEKAPVQVLLESL